MVRQYPQTLPQTSRMETMRRRVLESREPIHFAIWPSMLGCKHGQQDAWVAGKSGHSETQLQQAMVPLQRCVSRLRPALRFRSVWGRTCERSGGGWTWVPSLEEGPDGKTEEYGEGVVASCPGPKWCAACLP